MTGTSLDALDVAAVLIQGHGLEMRAEVVGSLTRELGPLAPRLRAFAEGQPLTARQIAQLALDFGVFHADACAALAEDFSGPDRPGPPVLVCVHGQTVLHAPPLSWQLINPWPIQRRMGPRCRVITDLRGADLAHGGQGAPITPLADWVLFRSETEPRALVNLGGYCNITFVPAPPRSPSVMTSAIFQPASGAKSPHAAHSQLPWHELVSGRDVCACNHLLDACARLALGIDYDPSGHNAAEGMPDSAARNELVGILRAQSRAGRSLGSGDEATLWARRHHASLSGADLLASCVDAVAEVIAEAVLTQGPSPHPTGDPPVWRPTREPALPRARVIVAGGGAFNETLLQRLAHHLGPDALLERSDNHRVPITTREAAEMGVLGALSMDGVPITLPAATGVPAPAPLAGAWYGPPWHRVPNGQGDSHTPGHAPATEAPVRGGVRDSTPPGSATDVPADRSHVLTEQRNPRTRDLDLKSVLELVRAFNDEDAQVAAAVRAAEAEIAAFIEALEERMRSALPPGAPFDWHAAGQPRLIYIGAGTSGRLGVLDASECPPTFHVDPAMVHGIIAGGDASLRRSSESREDEIAGADDELERLGVGPRDTLLGIAAGGTTPYVLGAIATAKRRGALTALLSCAPLK